MQSVLEFHNDRFDIALGRQMLMLGRPTQKGIAGLELGTGLDRAIGQFVLQRQGARLGGINGDMRMAMHRTAFAFFLGK